MERRHRPAARRVFPFRLARQAVGGAGFSAEPFRIGNGIFEADKDDRPATAAPSHVVWPISAAAAVGYAGIPFVERHFILADRVGLANEHFVVGIFLRVRMPDLVFRRTHEKFTSRHHHHLGTLGTIAKCVAGLESVVSRHELFRGQRRRKRENTSDECGLDGFLHLYFP